MSSNEILQYLFFAVVGTVALVVLWYIFIKAPQARLKELEPWARSRGLAFYPPVSLGSHTTGLETTTLQGTVQGVALTLRSSRLVNSRRAGMPGATEIALRALAPTPVSFSITLEPGRPPGSIPTGDPAFDANVSVRTDNPHAAVAWLNPQLRGAIYALIAECAPIVCGYAGGEITLRLSTPILDEKHLDRVLGLVVAAGYARLG
jgi:hypothetical protein